jgi:hypothetical protein
MVDIGLKGTASRHAASLEGRLLVALHTEQARGARPVLQWWPALAAIVIVVRRRASTADPESRSQTGSFQLQLFLLKRADQL